MNSAEFDFAFTLFGLVLGLALTEVLAGFVRTLRAGAAVRLGLATPMLAAIVALDLISFWFGAWEDRGRIAVNFATLVFAAALSGTYYVAASFVFPAEAADCPDLEEWFARSKRKVAWGILVANAAFTAAEVTSFGWQALGPITLATQAGYLLLAFLLTLTKRGWQSVAVMGIMLAIFAWIVGRTLV